MTEFDIIKREIEVNGVHSDNEIIIELLELILSELRELNEHIVEGE